ncbi:OmpA family protein [Inmirania thermothiophila]|uniref:Outer membrane protein OmpA-like peptidoglycan-associated protein n=1 Tax=Inmirania thermothiophila TaxID=1750597 RepID=A0A3N1XT62_9GAMM|nr:OmpA family protein [Inmirania thermothiophila]ROR29844.1 outer membrane protein OmpA-like peptidoglycan-associated protein [Inmirania thermothiophila]
MRLTVRMLAAVTAAALAGCAADDPNRRAKTGAAVGAAIGAVLGNQAEDRSRGRIVGAAVGAIAGAAVGSYMDRQRRELEARLVDERARNDLAITELPDGSLKVGVASEATFELDRYDLRPQALQTFAKIADVLRRYDRTVIHVVGHTDSTGPEGYNQALSERRAEAVASFLVAQGVPAERILTEGRGEREPVAPNDTPEGRRRNRRVDIVIRPVVEGREAEAYAPPPPLGR